MNLDVPTGVDYQAIEKEQYEDNKLNHVFSGSFKQWRDWRTQIMIERQNKYIEEHPIKLSGNILTEMEKENLQYQKLLFEQEGK